MAGVSNTSVEHDAKTRGIILHIVEQIKSQGVFDRFRRDCLEELDSKEPYRQLKQRVESHVATFLSKQMFSANLPKNQLRTSLRANINQSEVLSKGVDRLLEQVLVEKSGTFYKEIESLVEEHLISTGHYKRDKSQRSEHTKLSDKEVEDIIKEETNRLLEASADEKSQESDGHSTLDSPPPGTSGQVIEVEALINTANESVETFQAACSTTHGDVSAKSSETGSSQTLILKMSESKEVAMKTLTEENQKTNELDSSYTENCNENPQHQTNKNRAQEVAQKSVPQNRADTNQNGQISKPESLTVDALDIHDQAMDIKPTSSRQRSTELLESVDVKFHRSPEIQKSEDRRSAGETDEAVGAKTEKRDVDAPEVDWQPEESKAELLKKTSHVRKENPIVEIKKAIIQKPTESYSPEVNKLKIVKPEGYKREPKAAIVDATKAYKDKAQKPEAKGIAQTTSPKTKQKPFSKPNFVSTNEETDEVTEVTRGSVKSKREFSELDTAELSDSDITVSSVHTSDLSSLEDSMSDMEFEDYQELAQKKEEGKDGISTKDEIESEVGKQGGSDSSEKIESKETSEGENFSESSKEEGELKKSGESTGKKNEDSESATAGEEVDIKEENQEKCDESCSTPTEGIDVKEEKSGDDSSQIVDGESEVQEKKSGVTSSARIDTEKINEDKMSGEPDIHSRASFENKTVTKEAEDFTTSDENNIEHVDTIVSTQDHPSTSQKIEPTRSLSSPSSDHTENENQPHSKDEQLPCSKDEQLPCSQETTSSPSQSNFSETAESRADLADSHDSESAISQATDAASDADNEAADSDVGNIKFGKQNISRQISTEQESVSSNDTVTSPGEQTLQRRSARVASKDKKPDEKDDEGGDLSRSRRKRSSQDKNNRGPNFKEERRNERAEKRQTRLTSESNDSENKPSKRSKRTVRPTRCYSPSENS